MVRRNRIAPNRRVQRSKLLPVRVARMLEQIADDTHAAILHMSADK